MVQINKNHGVYQIYYLYEKGVGFVEGSTEKVESGFVYRIESDETVTILGYKSEYGKQNLVIPGIINDRVVRKIADHAFLYDYDCVENDLEWCVDYPLQVKLVSVSIPLSVNYIGDYAFYNNSFTEITISQNVKYIGEMAFASELLNSSPKKPGTWTANILSGWNMK